MLLEFICKGKRAKLKTKVGTTKTTDARRFQLTHMFDDETMMKIMNLKVFLYLTGYPRWKYFHFTTY